MLIRMLDAWSAGMPRLARAHVSTEASADDAAQKTLLAVIKGWAGLRPCDTEDLDLLGSR
jgi:DNA-directed RNA polymerase specialized sigma24 family protein